MTNFIVPIDFSETSKNAARYAAHLSAHTPNIHLILYNVFDTLEYGSDSSPLGTDKEKMLDEFNPEFYFIRIFDFMEAINQFVKDKKIDLILTVPKKRSFLTNLFKTTHTSRLAYHSHVPIVAINS